MRILVMRKRLAGERGQTMVLGALGVLLVSLMMLLTLNIGKAVYEKVRIQQLADAAAFSTATLEARSFNFYAYTNRANIAGLVAGVSAHGFMSLASTVPGMFKAAAGGFFIMAGIEIGLCCACPYCSCVTHCIHAGRDIAAAFAYLDRGDELADGVKDTSETFITAIKLLDAHVKLIAAQQQAMRAWTAEYALTTDKAARELVDKYAPGAEVASALGAGVGLLNLNEYETAIENQDDKGKKKRKWLGTEIANGTRYTEFVTHRTLYALDTNNILLYIYPQTLKDFMRTIPQRYTNGFSMIVYHEGESRVVKGGTDVRGKIGKNNHGPDGDALAAADEGAVLTQAYCAVGGGEYDARVGTDKDSGEHKCHADWISFDCCKKESKHKDAFKCLGDGGLVTHNCFMIFHSNKEATEDFGQPRVYAAIESDLRRTKGQGPKPAWEVTDSDSGKITVNLGGDVGQREMQLTDNPDEFGRGLAVSKAMVYYHHPEWTSNQKGWKEAPNFFNPYWKAKLQPFRDTIEFEKVLAAAGYGAKYAAMVAGGLLLPPPLP